MAGKFAGGDSKRTNPGTTTVSGRFQVGAAGAVGTIVGKGFTPTLVTTGLYKIALKRQWKTLVSDAAKVMYADNTAVDALRVNVSNPANVASSSPFFQLCVLSASTLTAPASGDYVSFAVELSASRLT